MTPAGVMRALVFLALLACDDDSWHWRSCPSVGATRFLLAVPIDRGQPRSRTFDPQCEGGDTSSLQPAVGSTFNSRCRWQWEWIDPRAVRVECPGSLVGPDCAGTGEARLVWCGISWRTETAR